ncbi:MAG: pyruvate ferredoxin oxidoreductase [Candidatus Omnitrophica bacterium]|nr:pyruvate ferredoxin oxidoreductase [Candidatus Omnitrophota bacterium]
MTKKGPKKITEVKVGDEVYAFDQKTYQLVVKKCTGVFDNGIKPVYELKTLHHSIKATDNHPFLVLKRNGFIWKTLGDIETGDEIVVCKNPVKTAQFSVGKVNIHTASSFENNHFSTEKVKSIEFVGEEPTLDLRVEDEHNFIADGIVVHNTGIQRSSATPKAAHTTTSPLGKVIPGKGQFPKDLPSIMVAHNIPYVATSIPGRWNDLVTKVEKAVSFDGFTFIDVLSPCRLGWPHEPELTMEISRLAVDTCIWPIYEVVEGRYKLTYKPKEKKPVVEWFKLQRRFAHLLKPENHELLEEIQKEVDRRWEILLKKCEG